MSTTIPAGGGELLPGIARTAIAQRLGRSTPAEPPVPEPVATWLALPGASFVTLTQQGQLRGCIGSLQAHRPLRDDVVSNAHSAAFRDPRFAPVRDDELDRTQVEVSVLSQPEPLPFTSRDQLLGLLRPGVDGLVLTAGGHRGTFLPQVWEQLPEPEDFLAQLVRKAGLPAGFWDDQVRLERYTVTAFHEADHD